MRTRRGKDEEELVGNWSKYILYITENHYFHHALHISGRVCYGRWGDFCFLADTGELLGCNNDWAEGLLIMEETEKWKKQNIRSKKDFRGRL